MRKPELLAPAGNPDSLRAAISGGADAVYLGLDSFSARQKAGNFTLDELKDTLELAHKYQIKVYVAINTLIKEEEIKNLLKVLDQLRDLPVDGLIVQDLGLIYLLQNFYPEFSLQLSTQASVYGKEGAKFFDDLGFDRVVLARETGIKEVEEMKEDLDTEIKIFNHGALCYAYSGQCHLSSAIGKRSGNRGTCAQPCRNYYKLSKNGRVLKEGFLLSTKDLNTLDRTDELLESGADALKIEGRMKTPEYVYAVTKAYRDKLEQREIDESEVRTVFNRDFTDGRLFSNTHNLSQINPKKRGELIGKVTKSDKGKLSIKLKKGITLINGDGISFGEDEKQGMNVSGIFNSKNKKVVEGKDLVKLNSNLSLDSGTPVYRSFNKQVMDKLDKEARTLPEIKREPIDVNLWIEENNPVKGEIEFNNNKISYISNIITQKAKSKPLDHKTVKKQLSKLGDTSFELRNLKAKIDPDLFLSIKELNQIRRELVDSLKSEENKANFDKVSLEDRVVKDKIDNPVISVKFENLDQVRENLEIQADEVVITVKDFINLTPVENLIKEFKSLGKQVLLTTPLVIDTNTAKLIKKSGFLDLKNLGADGYLIPNFELLELLKETDGYKEVDSSFNIFNSYSGDFLKDWNINSAVLSDELTQKEIRELSKNFPISTTLNAGGKRILMVSANCVFDCPNCTNCQNKGIYNLENLRGDKFKLKVEDRKNFIYNNSPTILGDSIKQQPYINKFRINLTDETPDEVKELIEDFKNGVIQEEGNYKRGVA